MGDICFGMGFFTQHTDRSSFLNYFLRKSTRFPLQRNLAFLCVSSALSTHADNSSLTVQVCWCALVWNTETWKLVFTSACVRNWFHQSLSFDELFGQTIFWECNSEIIDTIVWSWTSNCIVNSGVLFSNFLFRSLGRVSCHRDILNGLH